MSVYRVSVPEYGIIIHSKHSWPPSHTVGCHVQMCGSQKLLDQLTESNKLLDSVQKGLADYLETKRLAFARWEIQSVRCTLPADASGTFFGGCISLSHEDWSGPRA